VGKVLSQGGRSLADQYDVVGSVAGIDELDSREVSLVHEMGAVLFSERFRVTTRRLEITGVLQSTAITLFLDNLPTGVTRLLGVQCLSDDGSRIANMQVSLFQPTGDQDFPIWVYSGNTLPIIVRDDGSTVTQEILVPEPELNYFPNFTGGDLQGEDPTDDIRVRGITTAFGAGTVDLTVVFVMAFTFTGGVSPFGARIPSW